MNLCEDLGIPGRKVKESEATMENIPPTMVLHKIVGGSGIIFITISGTLLNNPLKKCLGVIRRGTHQAASEDIRWTYEPVSDLGPDIEPDSHSSVDGLSYQGIKYQKNLDNQEHEVTPDTRSNPIWIIRGDQRALRQLKIEIESSKDKLFFTKHIYVGSTQAKWYLIQVDMDQSDPFSIRDYGMY